MPCSSSAALNTWGWIVLGLGALLILAALTVFTGRQFARWFSILAAGLNGIGPTASCPAARGRCVSR
jgi:hypothetical protein